MRSNEDLQQLRDAVPIGGAFWAGRLVLGLRNRWNTALQLLQRSRMDAGQTRGVVQTIDSGRQIYQLIADVRRNHFASMDVQHQLPFVTLAVEVLNFLTNDDDQYAETMRPSYAGEGFQSERRLLSSFVSVNSQPQLFMDILRQIGGPLLHSEYQQLAHVYLNVHGIITPRISQAGPDAGRLNAVLRSFYELLECKQSPARFTQP